jgi:hypothetical protein
MGDESCLEVGSPTVQKSWKNVRTKRTKRTKSVRVASEISRGGGVRIPFVEENGAMAARLDGRTSRIWNMHGI